MSYDLTLYKQTSEGLTEENIFSYMEEEVTRTSPDSSSVNEVPPSLHPILEEARQEILLHYDMGPHQQINLYLPYIYDPDAVPDIFDILRKYIRRLVGMGNYVVFDPQRGGIVDLDSPLSTEEYLRVMAAMPELSASGLRTYRFKLLLRIIFSLAMIGVVLGNYLQPKIFSFPLTLVALAVYLISMEFVRR